MHSSASLKGFPKCGSLRKVSCARQLGPCCAQTYITGTVYKVAVSKGYNERAMATHIKTHLATERQNDATVRVTHIVVKLTAAVLTYRLPQHGTI